MIHNNKETLTMRHSFDLLTLAVEGQRTFCFVIREDAESQYYLHPENLPGGYPTEFEVGITYDKFGPVFTGGEISYIDQWLVENRPSNGCCYKQDMCEEHKNPPSALLPGCWRSTPQLMPTVSCV